jgi:OOP family OmpA-OmpF porin
MKILTYLSIVILLPLAACSDNETGEEKVSGMPAQPTETLKVAPVDSDHDGILDTNDRCADSVADIVVDPFGCDQDSDGDGVVDILDQCVESTFGIPVDDDGCVRQLPVMQSFDVAVNFASGKTDLDTEKTTAALADVIDLAHEYPDATLLVSAYTDSYGQPALNLKLSEQRAHAVAMTLIDSGMIATQRVNSVGHGEANPVASNATSAGREKNRRIVVMVSP